MYSVFLSNYINKHYNLPDRSTEELWKENQKLLEDFNDISNSVKERIFEKKGSKKYGILSVLTQAYYETDYLFSVPPSVFTPPPKVTSALPVGRISIIPPPNTLSKISGVIAILGISPPPFT